MGRRPYIIGLDWDGTCVTGSWKRGPQEVRQDVMDKAKAFKEAGAMIVLWTAREGEALQEAVEISSDNGLFFDRVNVNTPITEQWNREQGVKFGVRKIFCDIYVDDRSPGSIEYFLDMPEIGWIEDGHLDKDWVAEKGRILENE